MLQIENEEIFGKVIAAALVRIDENAALQSWEKVRALNSIAKAVSRIETAGCFMDYNGDAGTLLIWSDSNEIYEIGPDGSHGCKAQQNGYLCWHTSAKRLYELYLLELAASYAKPDPSQMPYLKPADKKQPEKIGGVRI